MTFLQIVICSKPVAVQVATSLFKNLFFLTFVDESQFIFVSTLISILLLLINFMHTSRKVITWLQSKYFYHLKWFSCKGDIWLTVIDLLLIISRVHLKLNENNHHILVDYLLSISIYIYVYIYIYIYIYLKISLR